MSLAHYIDRFSRLRVNTAGDHASPYKPCMLLAVTALAESGRLRRNRIDFDRTLLDAYAELFDAVRTERDHRNPYFPFFPLRGEAFWHLKPRGGRGARLEATRTDRLLR